MGTETAMDTTTLDELLHSAEQLSAEIGGDLELPRIERNLKQLAEAGQQLWSRTALHVPRETSDVRASVLLGSKGYDLQKVSQQLETLSGVKQSLPVEAVKETNIQGFLKSERENAILSVIEEVKKATLESAEKLYWDHLRQEWDEEKMRILNALVGPNKDLSTLDVSIDSPLKAISSPSEASQARLRSYYETSLIDTKNISFMDFTEIGYAKEVKKYVDQRVEGGIGLNLIQQFARVAKEVVGEQQVMELWEAVNALVPQQKGSNPMGKRCSAQFQSSLVMAARLFLERKYRQFIEGTVYGEPKSLPVNGAIWYNVIRNYLNTKVPSWLNMSSSSYSTITPKGALNGEDGLVDGHPFWYFLWHCLRAGAIDAAIEVSQKGPVGTIPVEFINCLRELKQNEGDRRLTSKSENQMRLHYKRSVRLTPDPYKRAVYCLLGCCDVNEEHSDVVEKVEDFLWLRLCQVKITDFPPSDVNISGAVSSPASFSSSSDTLSLNRLQHKLSEDYGEGHFNAQQQPFTYFKLLFLTGQFEAAVEFLSRVEKYRSHAVHVAIALNELGLLVLPSQHMNVPVLSKQPDDPTGIKRLNYVRLLTIYTRKFEASNPVEAIYYFYLLRNIKSSPDDNLFVSSVSRLVRESKDFDNLLGYISDDGCRIPGVVNKFDSVESIIDQIAVDCESQGFFEDAIRLFDLGSKHEKALRLINKLLSNVVAERKGGDSKRDRLEKLALKLADRYSAHGHSATRDSSATFYLLLDLMTFFDYYHNQTFNDALDTIQKLKIVPLESTQIDRKVQDFGQYSEEVRRNIPDILLATMNILYAQYKEAKAAPPHSVNKFGITAELGNREQRCSEVRLKARALITFAGMIPYRMPGDTNARLVQLEVLMN